MSMPQGIRPNIGPTLVVIPCLNEEDHVEALVRSLIDANHDTPIRIVIADGGSSDRTVVIAKKLEKTYSNVVYLHNPKRIQSAAVNLAVRTYGDNLRYFIRIDAHADYPANFCRALIDEALETEATSVVVSMKTVGKTSFQRAVASAQNSKLGNGGSAHRSAADQGKWVDHGHHALMEIDAFRDFEYDENFTHNEDAEFDTRLRKAGGRIWLTHKTGLTYYPRSEPWPLFRQYLNYGYGRARNIFKHKTIPKPRQLAPAAVFPALLVFLFGLLLSSPFGIICAAPLILWVCLCLLIGCQQAFKSKHAEELLVGPAAMIMHFGWSTGFWRCVLDELRQKKP